jgi:hypothetical protein
MKPMPFLLIACCCLFLSCLFGRDRQREKVSDTDTSLAGDKALPGGDDAEPEEFEPVAGEPDTEYVYVFENDTIKQRVTLSYPTGIEISFKYTVEHKIRRQNASVHGTAKNEYRAYDLEINEDEYGLAYPASEYIYSDHRNDCWLAFRLHAENLSLLQIKADCLFHPRLSL